MSFSWIYQEQLFEAETIDLISEADVHLLHTLVQRPGLAIQVCPDIQ